jgi:hypothetical protein
MEITRDVLDVLDTRLAAQDARNERLENRMEFMKTGPLNNATAGIAAVSDRRQRDSAAEALPAEQEAPTYDANFRHRYAARYDADDDISVESGNLQSYFRKRLSGLQSVAEESIKENTVVRTVANIDPVKSGILLSYLDIKQLYK